MELIDGGLSVDDRGTVTFVNDFDFKDVKRFYMVENHSKGFIRAWHGHKLESKYVFVTRGSILLATVKIDENEVWTRQVLSASRPQVLFIPAGYYNGFKTLTDDAQVIFFSTTTIEESKDDDYRKPADTWNLLEIEER